MATPASRATRSHDTISLVAIGAAALLALAGCGTAPSGGPGTPRFLPSDRDGPLPNPPANLEQVPDAEPRIEPLRSGGANKPYVVDGKRYDPLTSDTPLKERGLASWYGRKFHGRPTASGETYNMYGMTAAHPTMPLPSYARVRNPANDKEVIVRVNDRGPFHSSRVIDLSYTAALKLGLLRGVGIVDVERITNEEIRSAAWRRPSDSTAIAAAATGGTVATAPPPTATLTPSPAPEPAASPQATVPAPPPALAQAGSSASQVQTASTAAPPVADAPSTPVALPPPLTATAPTAAARGYWVQLGAFRQRDGAITFQRRVMAELDWLAPLLAVFNDAPVHRLQAGPYASREEASAIAEKIRDALKLVPVIVERR